MNFENRQVVARKLRTYRCGLEAGDLLRLKRQLLVRDHEGRPTGVAHEPGERWTVLPGVVGEPDVIWLAEPDGSNHTWDEDSIFKMFEQVRGS